MNTDFDWDKHASRLKEIAYQVPINKLTILTGGNGRGKSFIRKILWQGIKSQLGITERKSVVSDCSMERRTGIHSHLGGLGVALRDNEATPTSINTYEFIQGLVGCCDRFLVIDEPEIGMSEESQLGLANYLNKIKDDTLSRNYGLLVITHSRTLVANVESDCFINIEGLTKDEWLNRVIIPTDFEIVKEDAFALFKALAKRLK